MLLQDLQPLLAQGCYVPALDGLRKGLTQIRSASTAAEWHTYCAQTLYGPSFVQHPVSRLLKEGVLCAGSGLIHEPLILDAIYRQDDAPRLLSATSDAVRSWELALGFCVSLRARHAFFARELNDLSPTLRALRILAVGCGHLREVASALNLGRLHEAEIVAFDRDRACLDLIQREFEHPGLRTVSGSLRQFVADSALGTFDFIYVPTLFDTLSEARVQSLLGSLLSLLKPGGRLLAANFTPDLTDAAYLEACLDWWPFYREEEDFAVMLNQTSNQLRGQALFRDDSGGSVFLDLQVI